MGPGGAKHYLKCWQAACKKSPWAFLYTGYGLSHVKLGHDTKKLPKDRTTKLNPSESIRIHQKISVNNGGNFSVCLMVNICFWGLESWTNEVHEASSNSHSFYS